MVVACPKCGARYSLDPARLGSQSRQASCRRCGSIFDVAPPRVEATPARRPPPWARAEAAEADADGASVRVQEARLPRVDRRPRDNRVAAEPPRESTAERQARAARAEPPRESTAERQARAARAEPTRESTAERQARASAEDARRDEVIRAERARVESEARARAQAEARLRAEVEARREAAIRNEQARAEAEARRREALARAAAEEAERARAEAEADALALRYIEEAHVRAPRLDWKSVGVLAWRARTAGGRLHDFVGVRGLRRLLDDARLGPADEISHDGQSWTRINEIPDFDVHFAQIWDELDEARGGEPWTPGRVDLRPEPARVPTPLAPALLPPPPPSPAPMLRPPPPPPPGAWERYGAAVMVILAFLIGNLSGALLSSLGGQSSPPRAVAAGQPTPTASPSRPRPVIAPPRSSTAVAPRAGAESAEPAAPATRPPEVPEALWAATQLQQPEVAPGEGRIGDEEPPSDLVEVQEIPPEDAARVLKEEGL